MVIQGDVGVTAALDVPDDVLSIIVKLLDSQSDWNSFGLTCRRWLEVESCLRQSLKLDGSIQDPIKYEELLKSLLTRFKSVTKISLAGCVKMPDSALLTLHLHCPQLEKLSLNCCFSITDSGLSYIGIGCPNLRYLNLYRCGVSDASLINIGKGCLLLVAVNVSYCQQITDSGIKTLASNCPSLRVVDITNCKQIQGQGFGVCKQLAVLEAGSSWLTDVGLSALTKSSYNLEYMNISNPRNGFRLGPVGFGCIGACQRLQKLYSRLCRALDDTAVVQIATGCTFLREWNMAVCRGVKQVGWEAVSKHCKNLEVLHVNRCENFGDGSILDLQRGCPRLLQVYVHGCPKLTNMAIVRFKEARCNVQVMDVEIMV